jgi:hypothetical protein
MSWKGLLARVAGDSGIIIIAIDVIIVSSLESSALPHASRAYDLFRS